MTAGTFGTRDGSPTKTRSGPLRMPPWAGLYPDHGAKNGVEVEMLFFVPPGENVEIWKTTVRNTGKTTEKALKLFSYRRILPL